MTQLKDKVFEITQLEQSKQKINLVVDASMKRVDDKLFNQLGLPANLKYNGFPLRSIILVEEKSEKESNDDFIVSGDNK